MECGCGDGGSLVLSLRCFDKQLYISFCLATSLGMERLSSLYGGCPYMPKSQSQNLPYPHTNIRPYMQSLISVYKQVKKWVMKWGMGDDLIHLLHLCASKMRMEPLLFTDENAPEWAFSKWKGVRKGGVQKALRT